LRDIDANTLRAGNQNFRAIDGAFSHHASELHVLHKFGFEVLEGDTNGDGKADFQIKVVGRPPGQRHHSLIEPD
jgi:serralysin